MVWTWASATCRGTSHVKAGTRGQDASACIVAGPSNALLAVVSDGAGSASFGGQGAWMTCRTIVQAARRHLVSSSEMPSDDQCWLWLDEARDRIGQAADRRGATPRQFAATLVAVIASETESLILHVGDGAAVLHVDGEWQAPSWPENGEYASTTFFVTDEPTPRLRITRTGGATAVAVFTDGIERLALDFASQRAHQPFFDGIVRPIKQVDGLGRIGPLSASLARYLDSEAINQRTDDDKSLILACRR